MRDVRTPRYPCVPGHELAGICVEVGATVTRVKVGDHVGVGCMVDACMTCDACQRGDEHKCTSGGSTSTYGGPNTHGHAGFGPEAPEHTLGGYTDKFVVHERFAVIIPPACTYGCVPILSRVVGGIDS